MRNAFHGPAALDVREVRFLESDEREAVRASINVCAELGIERDRSLQQE